MPIEYRIDHDRKLVSAKGSGIVTDQDLFGYQREVWSRADVTGFDELIDMSGVTDILVPSADRVRDLASLSAGMDAGSVATKFAIVAPDNLAFGLGRMYATFRELNPRSKKVVQVFRTMDEALTFLGIDGEGEST
jgi:hypothetical protein